MLIRSHLIHPRRWLSLDYHYLHPLVRYASSTPVLHLDSDLLKNLRRRPKPPSASSRAEEPPPPPALVKDETQAENMGFTLPPVSSRSSTVPAPRFMTDSLASYDTTIY